MWFALTAHEKKLSRKELKKEFSAAKYEIIMSAETEDELNNKLNDSKDKFPKEMEKYLKAGIKIIEAENPIQAKRKATKEHKYFDQRGQYSLF
jgi:hypothetical protein